ncbi:MAG: hypothetical protein C0483_22760 [Pirellula sp.]|nr:hypothetical protein [Pirellula sp.]
MLAGALIAACAATPVAAQSTLLAPQLVALAPAGGEIPVDLKVSVLGMVPEDAYGFLVLSDFEKNRATVEGLLHKLKVPFDTTREYADFNDFVERLEGWDSTGPHALVLMPVEGEDEPEAVLVVPVKDYKKFAASIGADEAEDGPTEFDFQAEEMLIAEKNNYALITAKECLPTLESVLASKKSASASCEAIRPWLAKQQLAGVVLPSTVQLGCNELLKALEEAKKFTDGTEELPNEELTKYLPLIEIGRKAAIRVVEAARDDLTHLTFSLRIDEKLGVATSGQAIFKPNGAFAALLKSNPPLPADCLKNLPAEQFIMSLAYAYPKAGTELFYQLIDELLTEASKIEDVPVDVAKLKEAIVASRKMVAQMQYVSQTQSIAGPGMYDGVYGIFHVEDSQAFLDQYQESMKRIMAVFEKQKDMLSGIEIADAKVGDIHAIKMSIDMLELSKKFGAPPQPQQDIMMKAMFGGEGKMTVFVAAATKDKVVMSYGEPGLKTIVESVKADKPGLADDVMIKKTAALLPSGVMGVGYVDIGGYIEMMKKMVTAAMAANGAGGQFPLPIPPFPNSPPLGYTFKTYENTATVDFVVPLELMENTRDFVMQIQGLIGAFAPR